MGSLPPLSAHRLGRLPGPDSSRAALEHTLAHGGFGGLETDVVLTADGDLALLHDPFLAMGTDRRGWAHETPWSALATARLRDRHGALTDERPLGLDELLHRVVPGPVLQLEVKAYGDPALAVRTAEALWARVRDTPHADRVEVLSFSSPACEAAARAGAPRVRLVCFADDGPHALAQWARGAGVTGVCVEHFLLDAELVARLQDGGLSVTTGTINDPELARLAAATGVEAITSDAPAALLAAAGAGTTTRPALALAA